jgi:ATP-dependent DNA ligase
MPTPDLDCEHRAIDAGFLYAFDLIELNGDDLRRDPLEGRKAIFDLTPSINRACASVGLSALTFGFAKNTAALI